MHLAELNIGRLVAPPDDPRVAAFMDNLDRVNGLAKRMPGFVWMMESGAEQGQGNTAVCLNGDPQFVTNLSVWETPAQLETFVFNTLHSRFFTRRAEWFETLSDRHFAMWWVPVGHVPSLPEALERLEMLRADGPSEAAFDWQWLRQKQAAHG